MKKIFTLLSLLPLSYGAYSQAITITATDVPIPTTAFNCIDFSTTTAANATPAVGGSWNYGSYSGDAFTNAYIAETSSFFTSAGVDVNFPGFKALTGGLGYSFTSELDFNSTNVKESGIKIEAQAYNLSSTTGSVMDSLTIPAQQALIASHKEIMKFPFTAGSNWSSVSRRYTDFFLTVGSASLDHAPAQHVYYVHRKDTIAGWGKVRVYTASGPSKQYDVLMDKISQYSVDSFYLGGAPAPTALLSGFGLSQGQMTDYNYRYNFYRKGYYNYLLSFSYVSDATFSTPLGKYAHTDNIVPASVGIDALNDVEYTTVVFPNPSMGSELNLAVSGKTITADQYCITDMSGKIVQAGPAVMTQGLVHVALNGLANGNYMITLMNKEIKVITELFNVAR